MFLNVVLDFFYSKRKFYAKKTVNVLSMFFKKQTKKIGNLKLNLQFSEVRMLLQI